MLVSSGERNYREKQWHVLQASFVLCRMFVKSRGANSVSENVISSCAEERFSAIRHIGIQHDGFLTPESVEAKVHNRNSIDRDNDVSRYSGGLSRELDDEVIMRSVSVASVKLPSGIQSHDQGRSPRLTGGSMFVGNETTQQLLSIREEDFIELEDLVD